jgi:glycine betaine/proline transport system substrate-binding protein
MSARSTRAARGSIRRRPLVAIALALALSLVAAACGGDDDTAGGDIDTIKLAVNPWNGSAANVAVAANLLENELGYTVETVEIDENAQWAAINTGELHASLEVWPSGHADNVTDFIDNGDGVVNAGLLGPVGKIGWYTPTYMVDQHPELATWEGFADPALAGLYATAETGDAGQFLGGDPSFVQYDEDIITNLGLPLEVVYAGSEEAILASLDSAISRDEPVLVYLWTPHSAHNAYDLTEVALPAYSDDCYATAEDNGVDCDYPADELFKIVWSGLAEGAPDANTLLTNMRYATSDQVAMLASIETDGMSVEDAAAKWIADNEATWSAWLPEG